MLPELRSGFTILLKVNIKKLVYLKPAFINQFFQKLNFCIIFGYDFQNDVPESR